MNRRRFLQFTIALAVAAPIARLLVTVEPASDATVPMPPGPQLGAVWIPTQAEVDEWLDYYKICVQQGCERFQDLMRVVYAVESDDEGAPIFTDTDMSLENYRQAERGYTALAADRYAVAMSQGAGYAAGRDGLPRHTVAYTAPSNEAFGWYNMWAVGDADRRGVRLPRSPGVTWPDGRRPPTSLKRYW
jgi:hypothetical protein